jgi:F0F1-type ATP synthase assembly protein I
LTILDFRFGILDERFGRAKIHKLKLMESRNESPLVILTRALPPAVVGAMVVQVALIVGVLMIGSVLVGLALDTRFGTRPLITLLLALLSLPLSVGLTYRIAMQTVKKARRAYEEYLSSQKRQHTQDAPAAEASAERSDGLAVENAGD